MKYAKDREVSPGKVVLAVATSAVVLALAAVFAATKLAAPAEAQEQRQETAAGSSSGSRFLFDDFDEIRAKPRAPWYRINWDSENGEWQRREDLEVDYVGVAQP